MCVCVIMFIKRSYLDFLCNCFFRGIFPIVLSNTNDFKQFIWHIDGPLTDTTTPGQSVPGSYGNQPIKKT